MTHWTKYPNNFLAFTEKMKLESERATNKFPKGERLTLALTEEVGEVAKALLKIKEDGANPQDVYDELVQVASTAYRLATLGDKPYGYEGTKCHHSNCQQPCAGGPCALCYE